MSISPPNLCGLVWQNVSPGIHRAWPNDEFWPVYRAYKNSFFTCGIKIERLHDDSWKIIFTERYAPANPQAAIDQILRRHKEAEVSRIAAEIKRMEEATAARETQAVRDAEIAKMHAEVLAERLQPAVEAARRCLVQYGEFTVQKKLLRRLVEHYDDPDAQPLTVHHLASLEDYVSETKLKSAKLLDRAKRMTGGVDWPYDDVVEAITTLTERDDDHAQIDNDRGWNKPDSPAGHWAYAMLDRHPEVAIRLGRTLVGKYAETQLGRTAA